MAVAVWDEFSLLGTCIFRESQALTNSVFVHLRI